jgi:hypothetical protein
MDNTAYPVQDTLAVPYYDINGAIATSGGGNAGQRESVYMIAGNFAYSGKQKPSRLRDI